MSEAVALTLSEDEQLVAQSFLEWHTILSSGSEPVGVALQLSGTDIRFRRITRQKGKLHLDFWVGSSMGTAVQLNQPGKAGSENPGTTIAVDDRKRRYLIRQGDLHGSPSSKRIQHAEFSRRTGLDPVKLDVGGNPAKKDWHIVARLDGCSHAAVRASTGEFVRRCWNARTFGKQAADDQDQLKRLFGNAERGGWYDIEPALHPTRVLKAQGFVYECLEAVLTEFGIEIEKPRHAANYEVDGTINAPDGPMLIEIKTGVSAADIYCGVGQLNLYPVILPDLAGHTKFLLLPGDPTPHLVQALKKVGVELHRYALSRGRRHASAVFTTAFLRRCGVPERKLAALVARGEALS